MSYHLFEVKRNSYGQSQYSEKSESSGDSVTFDTLLPTDFWTIKNPSAELQYELTNKIPGCTEYKCSSGTFALSPKASSVIKPEGFGQGAAIILTFTDIIGEKWFLMVADNKPYLQHVQGGQEYNETSVECAKRECFEETLINLKDIDIVEVANYGYTGGNDLVDCRWECRTKVYFADLFWESVQHLFPNGLVSNKVNIVNVKDCGFEVDEVSHIFAIPFDFKEIPESFEQIVKNKMVGGKLVQLGLEFGKTMHHRQLMELFNSDLDVIKPPFLSYFTFNKRYPEAFAQFKSVN